MIHVIFYSENQKNIPILKQTVSAYCTDANCTFLFFDYPIEILDYLNTSRPQNCAVFFETDILQHGLEIAEKVFEINPLYRFQLICGTAGDVEKLFYKGVTYFINSPYEKESLRRSTEHFKKFFSDKSGKVLSLKTKKGMDAINLQDIRYIMSDKRKVIFHLDGRAADYYYKLDEIEEMVGSGFLRCHQSYIVDMKRIKLFVEDGLLLSDDTFIPVSRKKYYASKRAYLSYITGDRIQ